MAKIPAGEVNERLKALARKSRPGNPDREFERLRKLRRRFGVTLDLDEWELKAIGDMEPASVNERLKELARKSRPDAPDAEYQRLLRVRRRWGPG